jgi:DNA-binding IclR family transcriptional regulator
MIERENVYAVTRALQILDAFGASEQGLSLSELSRRLGMGKPTVLRTARTLARSGYLVQSDDSRWRLGPAAGSLGVRYQTSFDVNNVIDSVLRRLAKVTRETVALFVAEGGGRTCVARVDRPSLERHHIRVGEMLPLDRGASGRVLSSFSGEAGAFHESIRRRGYYVSIGERDTSMSSIAIPVIGPRRHLFGALCVSGTAARLRHDDLLRHLKPLQDAGARMSRALASSEARPHAIPATRWDL